MSLDGSAWVACKPGFFLPVRVLSRLFRRLFLEQLCAAHNTAQLQFFARHQALCDAPAFARFIRPVRNIDWVVYAKRPFAGPEAVLAYLSRYTHRVAIANSRLIACDERGVTFKWKDYRAPERDRHKTMTLATHEFIRRFLLHVLPGGFHRIRHYGLFANKDAPSTWLERTNCCRYHRTRPTIALDNEHATACVYQCKFCGAPMFIIETFTADHAPRAPPIGQP